MEVLDTTQSTPACATTSKALNKNMHVSLPTFHSTATDKSIMFSGESTEYGCGEGIHEHEEQGTPQLDARRSTDEDLDPFVN